MNGKEKMDSKEILKMGIKKSWHSYEVFLILVASLEGLMMIYGLFHFDFHDLIRKMYFSCYVFLFIYSVVALFLNRLFMKKTYNLDFAIKNVCIYNAVLIFWSAFVSALDISNGGYAVTYMTILAAVGSLIALNPILYISVSVLSSAGMILIVEYINHVTLPFPFFLNHAIFLLVVIAVEVRNYCSTREQYMLTRKLEKWAEIDALTQVANRRALDNYVEELKQDGGAFTFVLLDVDNFKTINDTKGHKEGDKCLIKLAHILSEMFSDKVFRYGGDEFAVISYEAADVVADKMNQINQRLKESCKNYVLQICAGVYHKEANQEEDRIFELADNALYEAKQNGKARAVVYGGK
ncbi:MAG: GGDEF domain-containing protein [Wujia sp.]